MAAAILGPVMLAKTSRARDILVMSDLFTKYGVTVALQDTTAATVANALLDEWTIKFGAPDVINTDQVSIFKVKECRTFAVFL